MRMDREEHNLSRNFASSECSAGFWTGLLSLSRLERGAGAIIASWDLRPTLAGELMLFPQS